MPDRTRPALQTIDDETQLKMKKRASKIDPDVLAMQAFQLLEQAKPRR